MKRFLDDHNYDTTTMIVNKPLTSDNLKDNMDEKSYELLKDYKGVDNIEKIKPLIEAVNIFFNSKIYLNFLLFD